jgi:hypothetical protein
MITVCNPGRLLEVLGSFELGGNIEGATPVRDRESGDLVTLGRLLRAFLEDPDERITGPVRITIEARP